MSSSLDFLRQISGVEPGATVDVPDIGPNGQTVTLAVLSGEPLLKARAAAVELQAGTLGALREAGVVQSQLAGLDEDGGTELAMKHPRAMAVINRQSFDQAATALMHTIMTPEGERLIEAVTDYHSAYAGVVDVLVAAGGDKGELGQQALLAAGMARLDGEQADPLDS